MDLFASLRRSLPTWENVGIQLSDKWSLFLVSAVLVCSAKVSAIDCSSWARVMTFCEKSLFDRSHLWSVARFGSNPLSQLGSGQHRSDLRLSTRTRTGVRYHQKINWEIYYTDLNEDIVSMMLVQRIGAAVSRKQTETSWPEQANQIKEGPCYCLRITWSSSSLTGEIEKCADWKIRSALGTSQSRADTRQVYFILFYVILLWGVATEEALWNDPANPCH
jgi:hypothetical protein